ncbi:hypothetical protein M5K25_024647 [Dendrobium thyrsiflorum]|uniref:Uncharacterized protein n=1 Tax=Dendrobium thyrsiflorum TaxID=117978 RepID=A0ABD0U2S7_DENTH
MRRKRPPWNRMGVEFILELNPEDYDTCSPWQLFPHEIAEQIKDRLRKAYVDQIAEIFPDDEEMLSQRSDETVPEQWHQGHHSQQKVAPSHRPGKEPIIEEESNF